MSRRTARVCTTRSQEDRCTFRRLAPELHILCSGRRRVSRRSSSRRAGHPNRRVRRRPPPPRSRPHRRASRRSSRSPQGRADRRDGLAGLPAVLREQQSEQRQGLRERRRLRGRRRSSGSPPSRSSGSSSTSTRPTRRDRRTSTSTSTRSRSRRQRAQEVDFSTPYYTNPQGDHRRQATRRTRTPRRSPNCKDAKFGVQIGTTSLEAVEQRDQPDAAAARLQQLQRRRQRLEDRHASQAIVADLATAFDLTSTELPHTTIVGQFSAPGGDNWGLLLGLALDA